MRLKDQFEADRRTYADRLATHKKVGLLVRVLTLGLFDNRSNIRQYEDKLRQCEQDILTCESQDRRISELDLLLETIQLEGVRISRHIFADIPVLEAHGYGVDWDEIRDRVLERDGHECREADGFCRGPLQIHHVTALSKGGTNDLGNLVTLCYHHHCLKHPHMKEKYGGDFWC